MLVRTARMFPWLVRTARSNPDRILALLIRAHEIDVEEADMSAAFRRGYAVGFKNGVQHGETNS